MGTISAHLCCELCKSSFARNQEDAIHSFIQVLKTIPMAPPGNSTSDSRDQQLLAVPEDWHGHRVS